MILYQIKPNIIEFNIMTRKLQILVVRPHQLHNWHRIAVGEPGNDALGQEVGASRQDAKD